MQGSDDGRLAGPGPARRGLSAGARWRVLALINLAGLAALAAAGEAWLWWSGGGTYWVRCEGWRVGSGRTGAGVKWWPETTYRIESGEFRARFRTNARGYRARPEPGPSPATAANARPFRVAFVGDSFTEGMQVDQAATFCARIERGLSGASAGRAVVCENFGVAATGLFDYWHRITHDVLKPDPPDALVLCVYPGNDFTDVFPDDGFEPDGRPRAEYFTEPSWAKHLVTWLNLKSRLASRVHRTLYVTWRRFRPPPVQGPPLWWTDPAVAARAADAPAVKRSGALFRAIAGECRQRGTALCVLVVGPVPVYFAKGGESPLARMLADWGIDAPVIDVAVEGIARPDWADLLFPRDGHLNEAGHAFVADAALPRLRDALGLPDRLAGAVSPAPGPRGLTR
jgi:hypothetical protein